MKTLFVCKHNRFRSKVAESIFKKLSKSKNEVKSAGVQIDFLRPYVAESVKKELERRGYIIESEQSRQINDQDLKWAELIIIVADNVDSGIFKGKTRARVEKWEISDADEQDSEGIKKSVDEIEAKIKNLIEDTNK